MIIVSKEVEEIHLSFEGMSTRIRIRNRMQKEFRQCVLNPNQTCPHVSVILQTHSMGWALIDWRL